MMNIHALRRFNFLMILFIGLVQITTATASESKNRVYFLTGGGNKIQDPEIYVAMDTLGNQIKEKFPEASFRVYHNSEWEMVCTQIKKHHHSQKLKKLILIGHSFGAQAVVDISNCLKEDQIKVDLAVTLDPVHRKPRPRCDIMPENVNVNANYYQMEKPHGSSHVNHREDGSQKGITNTLVKVGGWDARVHIAIVSKLIDDHTVLSGIQKIFAE